MRPFVPKIDQPFTVRGTEIHPNDTPEEYLQKLARITLDEMFQLVGVLTTDGVLLECNRAALVAGGLSRDEVIGKPFWETFWWTVTPKTQADLRDAISRAAKGEFVRYDVEVYGRKSGTETMIMDFTLLPVMDETGRVVFLLPEGRDITEKKAQERKISRQRKRAELESSAQHRINRALAESADLSEAVPQILRTVCEVLHWTVGGLWIVDQPTAELRSVEVWYDSDGKGSRFAMASRSQSFVKGIGLPGRVWSTGRPHWIPDVMEDTNFPRAPFAKADGLHAGFGFPVLSQGKVLGVLEFFSHEIRQPDDDLLQMMASIGAQVGQYIQRVQAEQERYKLAAIVESSDDAIISKDLNGIVMSWNASAERMFGYKPEEMIGRSIIRIIPEELHDDERVILETLRRGDRIDHFETVRVTKSGERIEVSLTISPVKDQAGKIVGVAKIARDITQRKKTEQALRTTERLASVGRLAATVAHEINNPLEAVTNLVYLAKGTPDKRTAESYLSQAQEELDRVSHLTKQTLGFYRETKGAVPTKIGSLLPPLLAVFSSKTRNKAIHIRTEIRQDPDIMAVPGEIRQLLANILGNSIDALDGGGHIRIRLSSARELNRGRRAGVRLTIADSGPGIPISIRQKLFEPFFTTKRDVGTGLGLWISKSIVQKHEGKIRVKSSVKPGESWTAFSVFLPLRGGASASEPVIRQAV